MEKSILGFFASFAGINPRLNPFTDFLFLSQKRIRVISRNNPIWDFIKEMHPNPIQSKLFWRRSVQGGGGGGGGGADSAPPP